eukprot:260781_1
MLMLNDGFDEVDYGNTKYYNMSASRRNARQKKKAERKHQKYTIKARSSKSQNDKASDRTSVKKLKKFYPLCNYQNYEHEIYEFECKDLSDQYEMQETKFEDDNTDIHAPIYDLAALQSLALTYSSKCKHCKLNTNNLCNRCNLYCCYGCVLDSLCKQCSNIQEMDDIWIAIEESLSYITNIEISITNIIINYSIGVSVECHCIRCYEQIIVNNKYQFEKEMIDHNGHKISHYIPNFLQLFKSNEICHIYGKPRRIFCGTCIKYRIVKSCKLECNNIENRPVCGNHINCCVCYKNEFPARYYDYNYDNYYNNNKQPLYLQDMANFTLCASCNRYCCHECIFESLCKKCKVTLKRNIVNKMVYKSVNNIDIWNTYNHKYRLPIIRCKILKCPPLWKEVYWKNYKPKMKKVLISQGFAAHNIKLITQRLCDIYFITIQDCMTNIEQAMKNFNSCYGGRVIIDFHNTNYYCNTSHLTYIYSKKLLIKHFDILDMNCKQKMTELFLQFGELNKEIQIELDGNNEPYAIVEFKRKVDAQRCKYWGVYFEHQKLYIDNYNEKYIKYNRDIETINTNRQRQYRYDCVGRIHYFESSYSSEMDCSFKNDFEVADNNNCMMIDYDLCNVKLYNISKRSRNQKIAKSKQRLIKKYLNRNKCNGERRDDIRSNKKSMKKLINRYCKIEQQEIENISLMKYLHY